MTHNISIATDEDIIQFGDDVKGDSNPNHKYVLSERALRTMNFDTNIINIG